MPSFASLFLDLFSPTKAILACLDDDSEDFTLQFNPTDYSVTRKTAQWKGRSLVDGTDETEYPPFYDYPYDQGPTDTLNLSFLIDNTESQLSIASLLSSSTPSSVLDALRSLNHLAWPRSGVQVDAAASNDERSRPPFVEFQWGGFYFAGVISSVTSKVTSFSIGGKPTRATVTLAMEGRAFNEDSAAPEDFYETPGSSGFSLSLDVDTAEVAQAAALASLLTLM